MTKQIDTTTAHAKDMSDFQVDAELKRLFAEAGKLARKYAAEQEQAEIERTLRAALRLKELLAEFWTRWNNATPAEQGRMWHEEWKPQPPEPINANVTPPAFNAAAFIGDMCKRGVRIDARGDAITATPADRLTDSDRNTIRAHKAELIAALASAAVIA